MYLERQLFGSLPFAISPHMSVETPISGVDPLPSSATVSYRAPKKPLYTSDSAATEFAKALSMISAGSRECNPVAWTQINSVTHSRSCILSSEKGEK